MSIYQGVPLSFKQAALAEFNTDTYKIALYVNTANINLSTTAYTASGEVTDPGYTAGGQTLTGVSLVTSGTGVYVTFSNASWSGAITARCALIYNVTQANKAVAVIDFGSNKTSVTTFLVEMPLNGLTTSLIRWP